MTMWKIFCNYSCSVIYCSLEGGVAIYKPQCQGQNMSNEIQWSTEFKKSCMNMGKDLH